MPPIDQPTRNLVPDDEAARLEKLSSWQLTKVISREMVSLFVPVLKKTAGWLILLQIIQMIATQLSTDAMDSVRAAGREDLTGLALIAVFELVFTLVWSVIWILVISLAASRVQQVLTRKPIRLGATINQILIEQTRVLAAVIWRIPLIFPAGVQWVRLAFVPFVVLFDSHYTVGERDALNQSRILSYRRFWLLNFYLLIASGASWAVDSAFKVDGAGFLEAPLQNSLAGLLNALVSLASGLFLYSLYRRLADQPETMTALQGNSAKTAID